MTGRSGPTVAERPTRASSVVDGTDPRAEGRHLTPVRAPTGVLALRSWPGERPSLSSRYGNLTGRHGNPWTRLVAGDPAALSDVLHDRIVDLLGPVFAMIHAAGHVGLRQQWLQARDRIAAILQDVGREAGDEAKGIAAARALIDRPGSPLAAARGGFESYVLWPRQLRVVYHRATCCLALRGPEGRPCLACPARPAAATREAVLVALQAELAATG